MIERLRKRDLFAFAGEIILSGERRAELQLSGGGATSKIRKEMVQLLEDRRGNGADAATLSSSSAEPVCENDIFCEIVKMSYGKGNKNPVSGPTAFYEPKKQVASSSSSSSQSGGGEAEGDQAETAPLAAEVAEVAEMAQQDRLWNVGVVPQGR
jgi:hypothetical protein